MDKNTRASYFFSHSTPDEFVRMAKIPKTMWVDLYVDMLIDAAGNA